MKHRRWMWFSLIALLLAAAVALLVVSLPRLLEAALQRELAVAGVEQFALGETRIGFSGAITSRVRLAGDRQRWRYELVLDQVKADYTLRNLFGGEISTISVDSARLTVTALPDRERADRAAGEVNLQQVLAGIEQLELPFDRVGLDHLALQYREPGFSFSADGEGLEMNAANRQLSGTVTVKPSFADDDPPLSVRVLAGPGELPWVPDLEFTLQNGQSKLAGGTARLRNHQASATGSYPLRLAVSLDFPRQSPAVLSPHIQQSLVREIADHGEASLSLEGEVLLPAVLDLSSGDWYRSLPLEAAGRGTVTAPLAAYGIESASVEAGVAASGSLESMSLTLVDKLRFTGRLDGAKLGLPPQFQDGEGKLAVAGDLDVPGSVAIEQGEPGAVPLRLGLLLAEPVSGFRSLSLDAAFTLAPESDGYAVKAAGPLIAAAESRPGTFEQIYGPPGWPTDQSLALTLETGSDYAFTLGGGAGTLVLTRPVKLSLDIAAGDQAHNAGATVNLTELNLGKAQSRLSFDARLQLPFRGRMLPEITLSGDGANDKGGWRLDLDSKIPDWKIHTGGQLVPGRDVIWKGETQAGDLPVLVENVEKFTGMPVELSLASGTGVFQHRVNYGADTGLAIEWGVSVGELTGIAAGIAFREAELTGAFAVDDNWRTTSPVKMRVSQLSAGVVFSGVEASAQLLSGKTLASSRWRLEDFSANVFGGEVSLKEPAVINLPFDGNRITLALSNLRLGEILLLYSEQGVSGEGILSGEVPLVLEANGVRVDDGAIAGESPGGQISFKTEAGNLEGTNEQLAMTLRLVENFHYDDLGVNVHLEPSGQMTLAVRLKGNNPDQFDGRPINLNINLEENIFELIKVLKLTDELTRQIEKRVEQHSFQ